MASEPDEVDALYSTPPARFVEARKQLARTLRAAGRREEAQAIDKLARPTVSVWATNQLARRAVSAPRVAELLELSERLRDTQGRSEGGAFTETASAHRALLGALRADAERLLAEDGHTASPHLLGRIVGNLRAGAADPELRSRIAAGRLDGDVEETGFGGLLAGGLPEGGVPVPSRPASPAPARPAPRPASAHPSDAAAKKAEAERRRAEEAAAREAERVRAAERTRALREVERLRAAVTGVEREIERESRALREAQEALAAVEQRLGDARAREEELAASLAQAEAALTQTRG
jgi:hypothetical protein